MPDDESAPPSAVVGAPPKRVVRNLDAQQPYLAYFLETCPRGVARRLSQSAGPYGVMTSFKLSEMALNALHKYVAQPNSGRNMIVCGEAKVGKTTLACSLAAQMAAQHEIAAWYCDAAVVLQERATSTAFENAVNAQLLVLDELVWDYNYTEWVHNKLHALINRRANMDRPTIFVATASADAMQAVLGDFLWGRISDRALLVHMSGKSLYQPPQPIRVRSAFGS